MLQFLRRSSILVAFAAVTAHASIALAFEVDGPFLIGDDKNELSGIDCLDADSTGNRLCMVVDDEADFVQFATLSGGVLRPSKEATPIFQQKPGFGRAPHVEFAMPSLGCSGGFKKGKADGEAIAHAGRTFYVVGSHGCSRNKKRYSPESFVLSRIEITQDNTVARIDGTFRLSEAIVVHPVLAAAFGRNIPREGSPPDTEAGISIEAMTVLGDHLVIGFRSPAADEARLLFAPIAALFSNDAVLDKTNVRVVSFALGSHIGFRDIETLPDESLVVLVGPEGKPSPDGPYALRLIGKDLVLDKKTMVAVPVPPDGSPEAIEVLGKDEPWPRSVVVISDGADNGGAELVALAPVK